jgi:hypothetical protein
MLKRSLLLGLAVLTLSDRAAQAVIVLGGDGRNELAANQSANGIASDLQANYGAYLATPISANYFITAAHILGYNTGETAVTTTNAANVSTSHTIVSVSQIPGTDLALGQVSVPFTSYASIYNPSADGALLTNDPLTVFGRGTSRGSVFTAANAPAGGNGWLWGTDDQAKSWGTNNVEGLVADNNGAQYLVANFDNNGQSTEGTLSVGDSGGGVFIFKNGTWRLAGVNSSVELFRQTANGPDLNAAIYNGGGLYEETDTNVWTYQDPNGPAVPQSWYASYVASQLGYINNTIPEPASLSLLAVGGVMLARRRR